MPSTRTYVRERGKEGEREREREREGEGERSQVSPFHLKASRRREISVPFLPKFASVKNSASTEKVTSRDSNLSHKNASADPFKRVRSDTIQRDTTIREYDDTTLVRHTVKFLSILNT